MQYTQFLQVECVFRQHRSFMCIKRWFVRTTFDATLRRNLSISLDYCRIEYCVVVLFLVVPAGQDNNAACKTTLPEYETKDRIWLTGTITIGAGTEQQFRIFMAHPSHPSAAQRLLMLRPRMTGRVRSSCLLDKTRRLGVVSVCVAWQSAHGCGINRSRFNGISNYLLETSWSIYRLGAARQIRPRRA